MLLHYLYFLALVELSILGDIGLLTYGFGSV